MYEKYNVYYTPASPTNMRGTTTEMVKTRQVFFRTDQQLDSNNKIYSPSQNKIIVAEGVQSINSFQQSVILQVQPQINKSNSIHDLDSKLSKGSNKQGNSGRSYSKIQQRIRSKYQQNIINNNPHHVMAYTGPNFTNNQQQNNNRKFQTMGFKDYSNQYGLLKTNQNNLLNFPYQGEFPSKDNSNRSYNKNKKNAQPEQRIVIQTTLLKPKFGFKTNDNSKNMDRYSLNNEDELISFQTSDLQGMEKVNSNSLNQSKSASNFSEILRLQQERVNIKINKNGEVEGYMLSKIGKKQQKINKKLMQIRKNNEQYDKKIRQKQRQIQMVRKKMDKQQKQMHTYQSKIVQAYDNVNQNPDSLLLSSRNYESSNPKMQVRTNNKIKVNCNFMGMGKKLIKQIIYGKCMIFQSQLLQIGFDNKSQNRVMQLYFTVKQNLMEMNVYVENVIDNGYSINDEDMFMSIRNIPAGKKMKTKIKVDYIGNLKDLLGFMTLKIVMKINNNSFFTEHVILPFSLYRNFITQTVQNTDSIKGKQRQNVKQQQTNSINAFGHGNYPMVSQWQNCNDQFMKNPKGYLEMLFKSGVWIQENIYHVQLLFKDIQKKSVNILINRHNFAIEMTDTKNIEIVLMIGNFLAKNK